MDIYPNRVPYTYLVGWSKLDRWYYGVRYAKNCHPSDLWVTYFTSSKYVKALRDEHGEPDIIEIRKVFDDIDFALYWEKTVLRRLKIFENTKWLNKNIAGAIMPMPGKLNPRYGKIKTKEEIEKIRIGNIGKKVSIETRKKQSLARKGKPGIPHTLETKRKLSGIRIGRFKGSDNHFYGKTHTKETKDFLSKKRKDKKFEELFGIEKAMEMKNAISKRMSGENHHFYGKEAPPERKKNISKGVKDSQIYVCCIVCKKESDYSNYIRWHKNRSCDIVSPPNNKWITNDISEKYVQKDTILPEGWRYGRKNKKSKRY